MKIAIIGATGTLRRHVAEELRARGHDVRGLSRRSPDHPVDLTTGAGLDTALKDCEVVVDASNNSGRRAAATLVEGSRRLLEAERAAGVGHHVCVSVVGCDRLPDSYSRTKAEQERVVQDGDVPWSIVRGTQFHEFVADLLAMAGRWRVLPVPDIPLQTVAVTEMAKAVADVAEGEPLRGRIEVVGPEVSNARDLARQWRSVTGRHALRIPLPMPGKAGRALREGNYTSEHPDVQGRLRFADWLRAGHAQNERTAR
jgi:uncharacterized protein YbjT (DUF2867 family)